MVDKPNEPDQKRPITDMKQSGANKAVRTEHLKTDNPKGLAGAMHCGDLAMKWDLRKCFHQHLTHPTMRPMCRSRFYNLQQKIVQGIQNRTLPQGFSPSPYINDKVLADPIRLLKSLGLRLFLATDDLVCLTSTVKEAFLHAHLVTYFLGITCNLIFSSEKGMYTSRHTDPSGTASYTARRHRPPFYPARRR